MALTKEQQDFVAGFNEWRCETMEVVEEAKQLTTTLNQLLKRFEKVEKEIRDMARERL